LKKILLTKNTIKELFPLSKIFFLNNIKVERIETEVPLASPKV